jgi:hypothetical protein
MSVEACPILTPVAYRGDSVAVSRARLTTNAQKSMHHSLRQIKRAFGFFKYSWSARSVRMHKPPLRGTTDATWLPGRLATQIVFLLCLLISPTSFGYGPGCPYGTKEPPAVPSNKTLLYASMKWCGIAEAPSVSNPSLVCEMDPRSMMLRRHQRASDCIWIPQCRITMRSGAGFVAQNNFKVINDLDTSIGLPGDIVVDPPTELNNSFLLADMLYNTPVAQPKGIIAMSARRLINSAGVPIVRGIAVCPPMPGAPRWMAVEDPTINCPLNERTVAHEFGHMLGLCHDSALPVGCSCPGLPANNLMASGGTGATLTRQQCNQARNYLSQNTIIDPPAGINEPVNLVAMAFDDGTNDAEAPFLDILKITVIDNSPNTNELSFHLLTNGLIPTNQTNVKFWILLDTDNNPATGASATNIVPGNPIGGVEFVCEVFRGNSSNVVATLYHSDKGTLVPVVLNPGLISAAIYDISLLFCEPLPAYTGPDQIPVMTGMDFTITNAALVPSGISAGGAGDLFPSGLRIQAVGATPSTVTFDKAPEGGTVLQFPKIIFPTIDVPLNVARGEDVSVSVARLPTNAPLKLILGRDMLPVAAMTDSTGAATFHFTVPTNALLGATLVTIGVMDTNNAATADGVVNVYDSGILQLSFQLAEPDLILSWDSLTAAVLEQAANVTGPWDEVPDATTPSTNSVLGPRRFYRLRR